MREILIIAHATLQQLYLIRSKMLLIVRFIQISMTLKYFKNVVIEWINVNTDFLCPVPWRTLFLIEARLACTRSMLPPFHFVYNQLSFDFKNIN